MVSDTDEISSGEEDSKFSEGNFDNAPQYQLPIFVASYLGYIEDSRKAELFLLEDTAGETGMKTAHSPNGT